MACALTTAGAATSLPSLQIQPRATQSGALSVSLFWGKALSARTAAVATGSSTTRRQLSCSALASPAELAQAVADSSALTSLLHPGAFLAFVSAELPEGIKTVTNPSNFRITEAFIKSFYMIFTCVFCWGCVVFASMNDAYYESDEYRNAGGNGTQFWIYSRAEEDEESAREELWRDELRQEIEEKMTEVKELQSGEEKTKELV